MKWYGLIVIGLMAGPAIGWCAGVLAAYMAKSAGCGLVRTFQSKAGRRMVEGRRRPSIHGMAFGAGMSEGWQVMDGHSLIVIGLMASVAIRGCTNIDAAGMAGNAGCG
jgi:hypothetical protein